jgi:hypothetical protein
LTAALTVVLVLVLGASGSLPASTAPIRAESSPVTSSVVFNGVNVASHDSLGSAIVTSFSGIFNTTFVWSSTGSKVFVTQGEVSLLFLGAAIGTSSQQVAQDGQGTFTLMSDFTQNRYLFEGVYEIHATLQSNATTVFAQNFFIWVQATNHLTVVNLALILIVLLEIWQIAALGSVKKARTQLGIPPPSQSPSPPPSTPPSTPPPTPPSGGA